MALRLGVSFRPNSVSSRVHDAMPLSAFWFRQASAIALRSSARAGAIMTAKAVSRIGSVTNDFRIEAPLIGVCAQNSRRPCHREDRPAWFQRPNWFAGGFLRFYRELDHGGSNS